MDNQLRDVTSGPARGTVARITDQVVQRADQAREAVADFGRKTVEDIDAQRGPAAATLDHSAAALHQQANTLASVGHATADKLQTTADYVRTQDVKAMAKDVGQLVRRYPGPALAIAAAAGFIAARVVRSRA